MDIVTSSFMPGDPRLIDQIVYELKSQGIFDQFRKECIADVDTKPAYQNLSQRVEGSVMNFLNKQNFSENMNKNQLREQLRKNISESGFLETGVERIVDQVVNPKINTVFLPKVEDVVYRYLGIEKPNQEAKEEEKPNVDLLPIDLEAISPESVNDNSFSSNVEKKDESIETNENSLNSSNTKTEDESPPFELLEENTKFSMHEENSVDSHLSGISGLAHHESSHSTEMKDVIPMDVSQDNSQNSLNSEGNLSIVTSDEDTKMEICEDSNLSENKEPKKTNSDYTGNEELFENKIEINVDEVDVKAERSEKSEVITEEIKNPNEIQVEDKNEVETKKSEDKKSNEIKSDTKKTHKSSRSDKDRKDDKDKKNRSKSESKSRDHKDSKTSTRHSSSSKDKDRDKDKKDYRNGRDKEEGAEKDKQIKKDNKERDKSKDKGSKNKEKSEKDRDRSDKDKDKAIKDKDRPDKEKTNKDKSIKDKSEKDKADRDKEKLDKEKHRSEKEKGKSDRDKDKVDKEKSEKEKSSSSKHSKEKSSSSSKKDVSNKDKDKSDEKPKDKSFSSKDKTYSGSKHQESSSKDKGSSKIPKDKDRSKPGSSSSKDKDKERKGGGDSKSRSSDKHKKNDKDKSSHHNKSSTSAKKDKQKKTIDDHYSLKDKKSERRSTDRDSNDGSSKMSRNGSFTESFSQSFKGSSKESSDVFSSGSGNSSNSDKMEGNSTERGEHVNGTDVLEMEAPLAIKYIKPKFASNIHEAMKIMKIRKQLAKMERQNQLSLVHVQGVNDRPSESTIKPKLKELTVVLDKSPIKYNLSNSNLDDKGREEKINSPIEHKSEKPDIEELNETQEKQEIQLQKESITEESPMLKSQDLSMESFEAFEARLALEMSRVNCHMYGEEDDCYEYDSVSFSPVKIKRAPEELKSNLKKILFDTSSANANDDNEIELVVSRQVKSTAEKESGIKENGNIPTSISDDVIDLCEETVILEQIEVPCEEIDILNNENSNIIMENGSELVVDDVEEEYVEYIEETVITDTVDKENDTAIIIESSIEDKNEKLEEPAECRQDNGYENCDVDMENVKLDDAHDQDFQKKETNNTFSGDNENFRGFSDVDKDNSDVIKLAQIILKLKHNIEKINNITKTDVANNKNIPVIIKMEKNKTNSPRKEDRIILKHGLSLEATIKEVKNMSSTIQGLLQKNGKKLFIKIDKLEYKLPSKVLVTLQGMETKENVNHQIYENNEICYEERLKNKQEIQDMFKAECMTGDRAKESLVFMEETKKDQTFSAVLLSPKLNKNGLIEQNGLTQSDIPFEDDESPCYYFDTSNCKNEIHLKILNNMIGRLDKALEKQSLQIQNNIPIVKKRGRKRKAQSTENNNSFSAQVNPVLDPKRRHLGDTVSKQNEHSLCNTIRAGLTFILDVSSNQSFSLPLSPADSDKYDEHKKEEPVTVKTKRTGRVFNSKRYSSEDLYKPRPVLSCTSTRRRFTKPEEHKP